MTRPELEAWVRRLIEEACAVDPVRADEVIVAVTGASVFAFSRLKCRELRALAAGLFATARLTS